MWKTNNSGVLLSILCCPHRIMTGNAFSEILLSIEDVFQTKRRTPRRVPRVLSRSYCGGSTFIDVLIIPNCSTHYCQGFRNSLYGFLGQAEALAVPIAARLDRISEFVRLRPNNSVLLLKQYFSFEKNLLPEEAIYITV